MTTRQMTLTIPEKVLLAEKTDEIAFAQELRVLAAVKGWIESVAPLLDRLVTTGMWVSFDVRQRVLALADEK